MKYSHHQIELYEKTKAGFFQQYGQAKDLMIFSAPGRSELGGNHTDHQLGKVIAASINLETVGVVALNGTHQIRVKSEGYPECIVDLDSVEVDEKDYGTTRSLIRGVLAAFQKRHLKVPGFNAYVTTEVFPGSGLSSSASFEVLIGTIMNGLTGKTMDAVEIAKIGQYAENIYFGKPCGLMDQMACSVGNIITIDFENREMPKVRAIPFDFSKTGYALCIVDCGADHADLTDEYAGITQEMKKVSDVFGAEVLRQIPEEEFYARLPEVRKAVGDRGVLRAIHIFEENRRVEAMVEALDGNDFKAFLDLVQASGRSSWLYLQNVVPCGRKEHQELAVSIALAEHLLQGKGACRVHGGGFAGTMQAYVPVEMLDDFKSGMESVLGEGKCHVLSIYPYGGIQIEL